MKLSMALRSRSEIGKKRVFFTMDIHYMLKFSQDLLVKLKPPRSFKRIVFTSFKETSPEELVESLLP